jgi:hypothetical protein
VVKLKHAIMQWSFSITQPMHLAFPTFPAFPNWQNLVTAPDSFPNEISALPNTKLAMSPKPELIHQRKVTRVVKGAIAGGFRVSTVKVDKDGAIVLYSHTQAREECEEPRLPLKANEWDEVLKK